RRRIGARWRPDPAPCRADRAVGRGRLPIVRTIVRTGSAARPPDLSAATGRAAPSQRPRACQAASRASLQQKPAAAASQAPISPDQHRTGCLRQGGGVGRGGHPKTRIFLSGKVPSERRCDPGPPCGGRRRAPRATRSSFQEDCDNLPITGTRKDPTCGVMPAPPAIRSGTGHCHGGQAGAAYIPPDFASATMAATRARSEAGIWSSDSDRKPCTIRSRAASSDMPEAIR
ncbi:hypothetical protein EV216_12157, partial [Rhodovulum steppense]